MKEIKKPQEVRSFRELKKTLMELRNKNAYGKIICYSIERAIFVNNPQERVMLVREKAINAKGRKKWFETGYLKDIVRAVEAGRWPGNGTPEGKTDDLRQKTNSSISD